MIIDKVSSINREAARTYLASYDLKKLIKNLLPTPLDGNITFFNEWGYLTKFYLSYKLDGKDIAHDTGNMALGNKKTYDMPGRESY